MRSKSIEGRERVNQFGIQKYQFSVRVTMQCMHLFHKQQTPTEFIISKTAILLRRSSIVKIQWSIKSDGLNNVFCVIASELTCTYVEELVRRFRN